MLDKLLISQLSDDDVDERCGLVLRNEEVISITNIAEDPQQGYRMDMTEVLPHMEDITGTWHTHPNSSPELSGADYHGFLGWPKLDHYIVSRLGLRHYRVENGAVVKCA